MTEKKNLILASTIDKKENIIIDKNITDNDDDSDYLEKKLVKNNLLTEKKNLILASNIDKKENTNISTNQHKNSVNSLIQNEVIWYSNDLNSSELEKKFKNKFIKLAKTNIKDNNDPILLNTNIDNANISHQIIYSNNNKEYEENINYSKIYTDLKKNTLLETHTHFLRFRIDFDASNKYIEKWNKLKQECENTDNKITVEEIKNNCKLESNKNLPYLERCEGGLGDNNKQIRFRIKESIKYDNDILLKVENTKFEKWMYEELDDIIYSFVKVLNKRLNTKCVNGYIEIINTKMMYDDDDDDDFDCN